MTTLQELLLRATARRTGAWDTLRQPRMGVMLHYTGGTDLSGLQWLLFDQRCRVSYNWLTLDDGTTLSVAPKEARAWHAGVCKDSDEFFVYHDANSAFYGHAIAAESGDTCTPKQFDMVVQTIVALFREHQWTPEQTLTRITDHAREAWPRGRKEDTGNVLPLANVRRAVADALIVDLVTR